MNTEAYEALSYTWDIQGEPAHEMECDGATLHVYTNLHDALQALRWTDRPRVLWADAICIDQTNDEEKGEQVKMMGRIFAGASRVVVWVGERDERCECGETQRGPSSQTIQQAFAGICWIVNNWLAHNGRADLKARFIRRTASSTCVKAEHERTMSDEGRLEANIYATTVRKFYDRK